MIDRKLMQYGARWGAFSIKKKASKPLKMSSRRKAGLTTLRYAVNVLRYRIGYHVVGYSIKSFRKGKHAFRHNIKKKITLGSWTSASKKKFYRYDLQKKKGIKIFELELWSKSPSGPWRFKVIP